LQVAGDLVVARIGDQLVEVGRDGADVLGDGPLVIVEDADKLFRRVRDVIKRLERDAVGQ
jgi:chemotaxis protein histidine kinase CheA